MSLRSSLTRFYRRVARVRYRAEFRAREGNLDQLMGERGRGTRVTNANFTRDPRTRIVWPRSWDEVNQERTPDV